MKKISEAIVYLGSLLIALGTLFYFREDVFIQVDRLLFPSKYNTIGEVNEYYREDDFMFVQNTKEFTPLNKQDIINIYYTVINAGKESFTFFCPKEFPDCIKVIEEVTKKENTLSVINNYVHPFNSFSHIETAFDRSGKIEITVKHTYTEQDIKEITQRIDELSPELIKEDDTPYNNIKRIHDYIIEHAEYDTPRADYGDKTYRSDSAYGPLFEGKAICSGYTDLMQIYLDRLNIPNYKVTSDKHIWNAVMIDGEWLNLDLTWDDPVFDDGSQEIVYNFFLINTKKLNEIEQTQHDFNANHYPELIQ